jgi:hypothetical protein
LHPVNLTTLLQTVLLKINYFDRKSSTIVNSFFSFS